MLDFNATIALNAGGLGGVVAVLLVVTTGLGVTGPGVTTGLVELPPLPPPTPPPVGPNGSLAAGLLTVGVALGGNTANCGGISPTDVVLFELGK